jgi:hypothetical protein
MFVPANAPHVSPNLTEAACPITQETPGKSIHVHVEAAASVEAFPESHASLCEARFAIK